MADYYSILEKTISGLPRNTPEIRNAVYKKARAAIETQLRNMDPMPSEEAVISQLGLLEEAILLIDSEHSVAQPQDNMIPPAVAPLPATEPAPVVAQPVAEVPPAPSIPAKPVAAQPEPIPVPASVPQMEPAPIATPPVAEPVPTSTPQIAPSVGEVAQQVAQSQMAEAAPIALEPTPSNIVDPISNVQTPHAALGSEQTKAGGFLSGLIKLLVVLGILGGAGYALWINKDALPKPVQDLINKVTFVSETETPNETVKVEDGIIPEPIVNELQPEVVEIQPEVPVVTEPIVVEPEVTAPAFVDPEVQEPVVAEPEIVVPEVVEPVEPTQEIAQEETPPSAQDEGSISIGEVAYLYEEGSAGSGATRTNAAVTWTLGRESLGTGLEAEPVILGKMDISERGMSLDIKINRNIDQSLSASHLIEIEFKLPDGFSGKSVESIARFVMKATEEAPGEPLVAVPVKAGEAKFLIALDNLPQAVSVNTQLLRDAGWIDVPLIYGTGKRALLTLEKGGTGERVFKQAFQDWQNR